MLTTLTAIKTRLGIEQFETTDDLLLTSILKHVSARFEAECNRRFETQANATFEFRASERFLIPDRLPIQAVSSFELKVTEAAGWVLQAQVDYLLSPQKSVIELATRLGCPSQLARVTYTGGYLLPGTTPPGNPPPLPDDIEQACIEQVAYWYQRRTQLGLVSIASEGGSTVQQFQSSDLLPQVRATLKHYERWLN
jgi:hypothetical protein